MTEIVFSEFELEFNGRIVLLGRL